MFLIDTGLWFSCGVNADVVLVLSFLPVFLFFSEEKRCQFIMHGQECSLVVMHTYGVLGPGLNSRFSSVPLFFPVHIH